MKHFFAHAFSTLVFIGATSASVCAQSLFQVGFFPFNGLFAVTGYDHYMFTGAGQLIDVEDPANPQLVGSVSVGLGSAVIVEGSYAYIGTGMVPSVKVVDLSAPVLPFVVGSLPMGPGAGVFGLALDGNVLYAACADQGLASIDVTDPTQPSLIQQLPLGDQQARGVVINGNRAYVADGSGLRVIDITDPAAMQEVISTGSGYVSVDITADGSVLVAGKNMGGAEIFDLSDPDLPLPIAAVVESNGPAYRVQFLDDRLLVSSEQYGVRVYEMNGGDATFLSGFDNTANGQTFSAYALGDLVFVTGLVNGAAILRWGNVGLPDAVGTSGFSCFPVPAQHVLNWVASATICDQVRVVDASGRIVREQRTSNNTLDIASLKEGLYTLSLLSHGHVVRRTSFIKLDH